MIEKATRAEVSPYYFVELYLALGDVEKALGYLRRSFDLRLPDIIGIAAEIKYPPESVMINIET